MTGKRALPTRHLTTIQRSSMRSHPKEAGMHWKLE